MTAKNLLRFAERGRVRWVDDLGRQFLTTALSFAPRILYVEEGESDTENPGADLPAFQWRVLDHLDAILSDRTPRPLRLVQPLAHLLATRSRFRAFIDLPLPSGLAAIGEVRLCVGCGRRTNATVESLNQGWGSLETEGRTYWLCPTCYGDVMAQQAESPHAVAWRRRMAVHGQRDRRNRLLLGTGGRDRVGGQISALVDDAARNRLIADELRRRLTPETRALILTEAKQLRCAAATVYRRRVELKRATA